MNGWQFMSESPVMTYFLAWLAVELVAKLWRHTCHAMNVWKHGWPPSGCERCEVEE